MKKALIAYIVIVLFGCILNARTIWKDRNPYTTEGDIKVGTVVVVNVYDMSDMKFTLSMSDKSNSMVSSNPDMTITGFLPKVAMQKKVTNDDATQFQAKGKLAFSVATRVLNRVGPMLNVAGSRTYTLNGVTNIITVTGLVDPALMKGRAVDSSSVADFTLEIRGIKQGINIQRPPLKKDETASSNLTEQEKQAIIIDYLRKMLGELTR
ncbi:MAG TPA: flagellar basal body L-ring protein FlgH [Spirochaetota bacterium]|nr:flagellar basal body L-ring protein FlgH [Spirochaetota bacterium]HPV43761.1 flagellar basal body L-ring protein FlgH [Spirochaetota bacterium]